MNQTFSERDSTAGDGHHQMTGIRNSKNSPALKTKLVRFQNKVEENCNELLNAAARKTHCTCFFVYAHFSLPHLPVYFDSTGHPLTDDGYIEQNYKQNTHQAYMTNLGAARHFILKLAKGIQERSNGNGRSSSYRQIMDTVEAETSCAWFNQVFHFNAVYFPTRIIIYCRTPVFCKYLSHIG